MFLDVSHKQLTDEYIEPRLKGCLDLKYLDVRCNLHVLKQTLTQLRVLLVRQSSVAAQAIS
jgi:hypothetical protein